MPRQWQTNFSKGEISPEAEGRFDLSAYQVGCRQAVNVNIRRTGGLSKRMGTRFVAPSLSDQAKMVPFQFSDEQAYALEFGQAYMRPMALGGAILEQPNGLAVISITKGNPTVIQVQNHGFLVGDEVYFKDIEGMSQINDRFLTITAVGDANHFSVDIDSTAFDNFTGSGGGDTNATVPTPPTPPVVPPPIVEPDPPPTGTGSGGGYGNASGSPRWDGHRVNAY